LYGDGSPGALVNLVIKKPLPQRHLEFSASGGSAGFGRVTADATGPLNAARTIRYRVIGAGEWLENGFDNGERRLTFFPSLAIDLSPGVTLSVDAEFYHQRGRNYRHAVPATPATERGDFSKFPWDVSMGSPTDGWTGDNIAPGVRLDARLGATSSLHASARYTGIGGNLNLEALTGLSPDGQSALRYHYREISHWNEYQSDTFATSVVHTGAIAHTLVAGVEGGLSTTHSQIGFGDSAPLDLANPDYGPPPSPPPLSPTRFDVTRVGLYASDQMRLGPQVIVVPGVRWSRVGIDDKVAAKTTVDSLATPSLGVVVLPRAWFSIYANYFEGFEPPSPGENLESGGAPALAKNWSFESGAKFDLFGRRLTATAAAFHIRRTNIPEANERGLYQQIGEGTSHGLEFEAVGHISVGLTTRAGYAWTATKVTSDVSSAAIGNELPNAPHQKAEVWTRYRLPADVARGVMMAAGVVYEGERFTDAANTVTAPAYTRFDASSSWELPGRRHLTLGLAAENLTNRRYVRSGAGAVFFAGPPRRVALQLTSVF
jgi:iron complex outermembrane receptor protein